jgi:formyltetrahydrofolate deformylase
VTTPSPARSAVLTLSCPDVPGIVHAVTGFLVEQNATITQSSQFDDLESCNFFMRVQFAPTTDAGLDVAALCQAFEPIAAKFGMTWRLEDTAHRERVIIMVSKFAHCLNDLLFRNSVGDLNLDVVAVVSNHPDLKPLADHYGVPFRHIPVTKDTKDQAEAELMEMVRAEKVELVILARYMQILSNDLCRQLAGHAINIHHSMLPAFKGAKPYHQAHDRGVKFIGATAHYVTADLDEGPIIEQDIQRVDHSMDADTFVARGRKSECRALARAVRWHTENRVQLNGARTVVLQ